MSDTTQTNEPNRRAETNRTGLNTGTFRWLSGLVALIGLYIAGSPFLFEATEVAMWNDLIVGLAIFLLAGYNFYRLSQDWLANESVAALTVLLGLWALVSPVIMEMGSTELATGTALSGLIVAILAGYNVYANRKATTPERTTTQT